MIFRVIKVRERPTRREVFVEWRFGIKATESIGRQAVVGKRKTEVKGWFLQVHVIACEQ